MSGDLVRSFGRVVDRLLARLPLRVTYIATTIGGRRVQVHAEYDPGWSDTVGPVVPYARVLRVLDARTQELLVDDGHLVDDAIDPLIAPELAQLEATARPAAEMALLRGGSFRQ